MRKATLSIFLCLLMAITAFAAIPSGIGPLSSGGTIYVDDDNTSGTEDGSMAYPYNTIQEGVDAASSGDTVYVFNGIYVENVVVDKTLNLTGENNESTKVYGDDITIHIDADLVNVTCFNITVWGYDNTGIKINYSEYCRIENVLFKRNDNAILLDHSSNNTIKNNVVIDDNCHLAIDLDYSSNNLIIDNLLIGSPEDSDGGIALFYSYNNVINNNTINGFIDASVSLGHSSNNEITNNSLLEAETPVNLYSSNNNFIAYNYINYGVSWGLWMEYSSYNVITSNFFGEWIEYDSIWLQNSPTNYITYNYCEKAGINLLSSLNCSVIDNVCENSDNFAIGVFDSPNCLITNNRCYASIIGIFLNGSSYSFIKDNNCSTNEYGLRIVYSDNCSINNNFYGVNINGIYLYNGNNNLIYHNNIIDNIQQAYDSDPLNNFWHHPGLLEGNYWSDYTGTDSGGMSYPWDPSGKHLIAGDGIGDTLVPHHTTDYDYYPFVMAGGWEVSPNTPPVADANGPYWAEVGDIITLDGSGSYDPDSDPLEYRWDFDNDGLWDTAWSTSPYVDHSWGSEYSGLVVLEVSDGEYTDTDNASITIEVNITYGEESIEDIVDYIYDLPDDAFEKNPDQKKNTFSNKFNAVFNKIAAGDYEGAINKLENDIKPKLDGEPSPKDWIIDPVAQAELNAMIDDLIAWLETLI